MKNIYITALTVFTLTNASFAGVGGHGEQEKHWASPESAKQAKNPIKSSRRSVNKGEVIFMQSCMSCHGVNADGNGSLAKNLHTKPTNLRVMAGMHSDGDFAWKIANGKGDMPAWKGTLSETEIWNVVNFIQSLADHSKMDMSGMDHSKMDMSGMDHSKMDMSGMDHSKMDMKDMDHSKMDMKDMDHSKMDMKDMDHSKMDVKDTYSSTKVLPDAGHSEMATESDAKIIQKIEHNHKPWYKFW